MANEVSRSADAGASSEHAQNAQVRTEALRSRYEELLAADVAHQTDEKQEDSVRACEPKVIQRSESVPVSVRYTVFEDGSWPQVTLDANVQRGGQARSDLWLIC